MMPLVAVPLVAVPLVVLQSAVWEGSCLAEKGRGSESEFRVTRHDSLHDH